MKTKTNGENIYKTVNAWLRNFRSILAFLKKEIKDTKRQTGRKMLGEQLSSFHSSKFNTFGKKFIIQIT